MLPLLVAINGIPSVSDSIRKHFRTYLTIAQSIALVGCATNSDIAETIWVPDPVWGLWIISALGVFIVSSIAWKSPNKWLLSIGLVLCIAPSLAFMTQSRRHVEMLTFVNNYYDAENLCRTAIEMKTGKAETIAWYLSEWKFSGGKLNRKWTLNDFTSRILGFPSTDSSRLHRSSINAKNVNINLNMKWYAGSRIDEGAIYVVNCAADIVDKSAVVEKDTTDSQFRFCQDSGRSGGDFLKCLNEFRALQ